MSDIIIKEHDFQEAKKGLQKFSRKKNSEISLESVKESGGFLWLGSHKVTGEELNDRLEIIQQHFIDLNKINIDVVKEFGQVYSALEALDKDYIPAILMGIKSAEKASDEAKANQVDINKTLENQKKIVATLKKFKEKLDTYEHLMDIDDLWADFVVAQKELNNANDIISEIQNIAINNKKAIGVLDTFKNKIEKYKHICDVDTLWDDVVTAKKSLDNVTTSVNSIISDVGINKKSISELFAFKEDIENNQYITGLEKLYEETKDIQNLLSSAVENIDSLITNLEKQSENISVLQSFKKGIDKITHIKDVDDIWNDMQSIEKKIQNINEDIKSMLKKITENQSAIKEIFEFKATLETYKHLRDIDDIWDDLRSAETKLDTANGKISSLETELSNTKETITELTQEYADKEVGFKKNLKMSYLIAGTSLAITIVEFILILTKVI